MKFINNDTILMIGPENDKGGIGSVLNLYEKYLPGTRFISTYPSSNIKSKYSFFLMSLYKIIKLLLDEPTIKIIHVHSASKGSFVRKSIVCLIGKILNKKTIMHIHGGAFKEFYNSGLNRYYVKYIFKITDTIICLSEEWNSFYQTIIDNRKIHVLGNPVEDYKCEGGKTLSIKNNIKMLFLGNIHANKGIFELIKFLNENLYFKNNQIKLVIGGLGDSDGLSKLINKNPNYYYAGWINNKEKNRFLNECDVFILPSFNEGLPMSILEAMSAGKAIIGSNVGGIPSLVREKHNGWLIEANKLEKINEIFEEILNDKSILTKYGENSYQDSKYFHPSSVIKKLENIYNTTLNDKISNFIPF